MTGDGGQQPAAPDARPGGPRAGSLGPLPGPLAGPLLGLLLLLSGAAALAHEAAWPRLFHPVVGAGPLTTAAVVSGALLGLALGAALGGRLADRSARPGRLLAVAEALGALLALSIPWCVDHGGDRLVRAGAPVRAAVVVVVAGLAMAPLGVSLPAALRCLRPDGDRAGRVLGRLYAVNTLGAVVGVAWPTAVGFEQHGTRAVVGFAAAAQGLVALLAATLLGHRVGPAPAPRGARTPGRADAPPDAPPDAGPRVPRRVLAAAALSGAAGVVVQIAWVRRLTPALGTTSYAFGTVLAAYLLAIAAGTALFGPRSRRPAGAVPAGLLVVAALPVVLSIPFVLPVARWAAETLGAALAEGPVSARTLLFIRAVATATLLGPAVALSAAALPWLVHLAAPTRELAPSVSGRVYAWNAAGSAAAALLAGLVVVPALGTAGTLRGGAALLLAAAACVAGCRARLVLVVLAGAGVVLAAVPLPDAAGRDAVGATFDPLSTDPAAAPATFFVEGRVSTVVVRERDGRRELWVDGKVVASGSPTDRLHLTLLGHLPMLAHPSPARVAIIGLGTGITSTAVAAHRPARLDVFELEAAVVRAAEAFRPVGGGVPAGARVHVTDGRHGLAVSDVRYDVVTSDPIHPAAAGSAELYTAEHYAAIERRLAPGGLVCQWLPLYELEPDDVAMVLRTMARRFDVAVFVAGPDLVILGARPGGLRIDEAHLARRLVGEVRAGLEPLGLASAGRLLGLLVAGPARVAAHVGEGPVNTDDRPVLEFASARSQYTGSSARNLFALASVPDDAAVLLTAPPSPAFREGVERTRRMRRAFARWMPGGADALGSALPVFARLAEEDPSDRLAAWMRDECAASFAWELATGDDPERAAELAREVLARPDAELRTRIVAAGVLAEAGHADEAREVASRLLLEAPSSARVRRLAGGRPEEPRR